MVNSFLSEGSSPRSHPEEKSCQRQTFLINPDRDPTQKRNLVNGCHSQLIRIWIPPLRKFRVGDTGKGANHKSQVDIDLDLRSTCKVMTSK